MLVNFFLISPWHTNLAPNWQFFPERFKLISCYHHCCNIVGCLFHFSLPLPSPWGPSLETSPPALPFLPLLCLPASLLARMGEGTRETNRRTWKHFILQMWHNIGNISLKLVSFFLLPPLPTVCWRCWALLWGVRPAAPLFNSLLVRTVRIWAGDSRLNPCMIHQRGSCQEPCYLHYKDLMSVK